MSRLMRSLTLILLAVSLAGCATIKNAVGSKGQKLDPWESWNRKVFSFNEKVDENVLKPVATAYSEVVPATVRKGIDNFFGNIGDAWSTVNLFLQGRFKSGVEQGMRVAVNSTFGILGLFDIASDAGLEKNSQDLGKTFGRWGMGTGAYIVWPILGPSSVRDSLALPFDLQASPAVVFDHGKEKVGVTVLNGINTRANFLRASEMLEGIALDKYTFYRDAYLQRRGSFDDDDAVEVLVPGQGASAPSADPAASAASADTAASAPAAAAAASGPITAKRPADPASGTAK